MSCNWRCNFALELYVLSLPLSLCSSLPPSLLPLFLYIFLFLRQDLICPRLAFNSLCSWGSPWLSDSFLWLLSAGIIPLCQVSLVYVLLGIKPGLCVYLGKYASNRTTSLTLRVVYLHNYLVSRNRELIWNALKWICKINSRETTF